MTLQEIRQRYQSAKKSLASIKKYTTAKFIYAYQAKGLFTLFERTATELTDLIAAANELPVEPHRLAHDRTPLISPTDALLTELNQSLQEIAPIKAQFESLLKVYCVGLTPQVTSAQPRNAQSTLNESVVNTLHQQIERILQQPQMVTQNPTPLDLPDELYREISKYFTYREIVETLRLINRSWRRACSHPALFSEPGYLPLEYNSLPLHGTQLLLQKLTPSRQQQADDGEEEKKDDNNPNDVVRITINEDPTAQMLLRARAQEMTNATVNNFVYCYPNHANKLKMLIPPLAIIGLILGLVKADNKALMWAGLGMMLPCFLSCFWLLCMHSCEEEVHNYQNRLFDRNLQNLTNEYRNAHAETSVDIDEEAALQELTDGVNVPVSFPQPRRTPVHLDTPILGGWY